MIDPGLQDKVALITGANNPLGIGAATAKALAGQGTGVFVTSYRHPAGISHHDTDAAEQSGIGGPGLYEALQRQSPEALVKGIESSGGRAVCLEADLSAPPNIPRVFDACEQGLGPVDILVNNHAYWRPETFDPRLVTTEGYGVDLTDASLMDAHYRINTRAFALMMKEFVRRYLERNGSWGRIINVSTDAADGHLGAVSYAASKHAIESYARSAAHELGKYGITVNIVAPGPVQTGWLAPEEETAIGLKTPLGRAGRPEDIADVIVFLASKQSRWLTGQLLYVGGGWKMHQ